MIAILRLLWGLISRLLPGFASAVGSATGLLVASAAARAVAVSAAVVAFVMWLPMPGWLQSLPSLASSIPGGVLYVMAYARVKEGVTIILGAMVVRFLARLALKVIG